MKSLVEKDIVKAFLEKDVLGSHQIEDLANDFYSEGNATATTYSRIFRKMRTQGKIIVKEVKVSGRRQSYWKLIKLGVVNDK